MGEGGWEKNSNSTTRLHMTSLPDERGGETTKITTSTRSSHSNSSSSRAGEYVVGTLPSNSIAVVVYNRSGLRKGAHKSLAHEEERKKKKTVKFCGVFF